MDAPHRIDWSNAGRWDTATLSSPDGRVQATVVPSLSMLIWSLTLDGVELLGHPNSLEDYAAHGATTGIPLLHPWANRLSGSRLVGTAADTVVTPSRLIPLDQGGLPIHGLNLADAGWEVVSARAGAGEAALESRLRFDRPDLVAVFPFPHELRVAVRLRGSALVIDATVVADAGRRVPVSFGWHPYFTLPDLAREEWFVSLPVTRRACLDERMIPTGATEPAAIVPAHLGTTTYDDMFPGVRPEPFTLRGGGRTVALAFGDGYEVAQVYAPEHTDVIAFEPMTAPTNALVSGDGVRWVTPGEAFSASFTVSVSANGRSPL